MRPPNTATWKTRRSRVFGLMMGSWVFFHGEARMSLVRLSQ